jgi:glycosyltransferase involved in cell wall biosynthesis
MAKVLFVWNIAGEDGNIGSYRPSIYAAKYAGYEIDIAMNFNLTPIKKRKEIETLYGVRLINVDIDRNPYSFRKNRIALKQLISVMKEGYDIVHCNTPVGGILGRIAAKKTKLNRVFYMNRGFAFYKGAPLKNWIIYYTIERLFARLYTDAIATINPIDFKYANGFTLRNHSNLKYSLPGPGVELSQFKYSQEDREMLRKQYKVDDADILVLSVGELTKRKNFSDIIKALSIIKKQADNEIGKIYYMIVGEGKLQQQLTEETEKLGLSEKVIFAGSHENVSRYYSAADIFALPSLSEGFGRVGIEAMSVGLPLITSNVQGINLYSINGKTGFKYSPTDVEGYAGGIMKLARDEKLRKRISEYNKVFAREFSMEKSGEKIAGIYKALMSEDR